MSVCGGGGVLAPIGIYGLSRSISLVFGIERWLDKDGIELRSEKMGATRFIDREHNDDVAL